MERFSSGGYEVEARSASVRSSHRGPPFDHQQQQRHTYPPSETFRKASLPDPSDENNPPKLQIGATTADLSEIKPILVKKQITVDVESINAYVPILFQQKSFLSQLNPLTVPGRLIAMKKQKKKDDPKEAAETNDVEKGSCTANSGNGAGVTPPPSTTTTTPAQTPKMRQVLYNVSCTVHPGEVLALMGPSGSGKTTLLTIMGSRAQKLMKVDGSITYNDSPLTKKLKRQVGFVSQDDLLYEALTVHETLLYAAKLRLPSSMSKAEKKQRVDTVIQALGLSTCRDTIIGGFFRKGVSGGERKRTSVAHEVGVL
jgi:ABC-type glutathione transport system ATPase component